MNSQQTNQIANVGVGVGVDVNLTAMSAIYLLMVIVLGSAAFFACKKYIK